MTTRNRNVRAREFREMLAKLPVEAQREADEAFRLFQENPNHRSPRLHPLQNRGRGRHRDETWSVSVTRSYRALYVVDGDTNVWYWIGTHADHDAFTGKK